MEQKIITSPSAERLSAKMKEMKEEGWIPVGSHGVVIVHSQNKFRGQDLVETVHQTEYSQTMKKEE